MKYLITLFVLAQLAIYARYTEAQVTNWDSSPMNYQNSPMNYNSNNGVYDNSGKRIGYEVTAPSGVTNVFDNNGNRIGYSPSKR